MGKKYWNELLTATISLFKDTISSENSNLSRLKIRSAEIGLYIDIENSNKKAFNLFTRTYFEGLGLEIKKTTDLYNEIEIQCRGLITQDTGDHFETDITSYIRKANISEDQQKLLMRFRYSMDLWGTVEQNFYISRKKDKHSVEKDQKKLINPRSNIEDIIGQILIGSRDIITGNDTSLYSINFVNIYDSNGRLILMDRKEKFAEV